MNKKMLLSILILAFVGIGTAGTWATVNSVEDSAATGAITVTQPTLTLDYSSIAAAISADNQMVQVGKLTYKPDDTDLEISEVAVTGITSNSGPLSNDITLYVEKPDKTTVKIWENGASAITSGVPVWMAYSTTAAGGQVEVPIFAQFVNSATDQTSDVTSETGTTFTVTGIMRTTV